ncbi:hypothetical protein HanHA300_Chr05g0181551 [Helianthus annuus]|nr:hypothetical protein HanHA300_Chr05g0181551 [Helianthus annuus]KAJ0577673.1 hypothetical protein HanIR_Chr05g0238731 [Helianthus annuus]KAJ0585079.1 hypothetical protein HanHA89_Chr05g0196241 [Helianthus annuus]
MEIVHFVFLTTRDKYHLTEIGGELLGYCGNGYIQEKHVQAWCNKLMEYRESVNRTRTSSSNNCRWTVLPPRFFSLIIEQDHEAYSYANGSVGPYPALWEVDTVYIPLTQDEINWNIIKIDLQSLNVTIYYPNNCHVKICRGSFWVHKNIYQLFVEFESAFIWFLWSINYWRNAGQSETDALDFIGDVAWPSHVDNVGRNSGVIVCMLLNNLVLDRSMTCIEGNIQDTCMRYRRFMADELYAARSTPNNM